MRKGHWSFSMGSCKYLVSMSVFRLAQTDDGSGMKRNWQSLSKAFLHDLQRPVYTVVSTTFTFG